MYSQTPTPKPTFLSKLAQSIASGFTYLFKANPYHDAGGRFARKDTPANHHFVSVGGKFSRSNARDRKEFGAEQTALGAKLKPLFNKHKEQRLADIQRVVDEQAAAAAAAAAPTRRARTPRGTPSPAQVARAAALAQREAVAARRTELLAEREAVVRNNVNFRPSQIQPLREGERTRLQALANNPDASEYSRNNARTRLEGEKHGDLLRQHGLTLNSTLATAARVPSHHLRPDTLGQSLHELNAANDTARSAAAAARHAALGASLYGMSREERAQHVNGMSTQARRAASRALTDHVDTEVGRLDSLSFADRQKALSTMTPGQREAINQGQSWRSRQRWQQQETDHTNSVAEASRVKREGPHTGEALHNMSAKSRNAALSGLTENQRANAIAAESAHAAARASNLAGLSHTARERELSGMSDRQRQTVTDNFTPAQRETHATQRTAHENQVAQQTRAYAEREARAAAMAARAAATQAQRDEQDRKTLKDLSPEERRALDSVKALRAKGVTVTGGDRNTHQDPDVGFVKEFAKKYKGVDPARLIDGYVGKGTTLKHGTYIKMSERGLDFGVPAGATLHGSTLDLHSSRSISTNHNGDHSAENNLLRLQKSSRGGGSGKKHFAEMIPTYMDMGVKKLKVHGALENGFHTWAKYGFTDDSPPSWRKQAMAKVNDAVARMPNMSPEAKGELAKLQKAVTRFGDSKRFPNLAVRMKLPHLTKAYQDAGLSRRTSGNDFLAEATEDGNWYGTIDFSDKRQMARVSKYVKGTDFKYFDKDGNQKPVSG